MSISPFANSSPPISGIVTHVFPVTNVPGHLPLLFPGLKYGTKREVLFYFHYFKMFKHFLKKTIM